MNQEIIEVLLVSRNPEEDVLVFKIDDAEASVNLNSSDCQNALKHVFAELLKKLVKEDLLLELTVCDCYSRQMYIEVCQEYIKDLNRELNECKMELRNQLSID